MFEATRSRLFATGAVLAIALTACTGEGRPNVDVIENGGTGTGSASVSVSGPAAAPAPAAGGAGYSVVSNVDIYFAMALDLRDIRAAMAPAAQGEPVDWAAAKAIYENGKNQLRADGARSLASIPNDAVHAIFPNGAAVYGRPDFINAIVRDGLDGTGRAQGVSDNARRQMVDKGIQMLIYGKALQEMEAAKTRVAEGNTDNARGAPHAVDEAWGAVAGAPDNNLNRPYALLQTASGREGNFGLEGKLRDPLVAAFVASLAAAQEGDAAAFETAHEQVKGYLNTIFYLGSLRYVKELEGDDTAADRQTHLAEGWTFWQTIRAAVAQASPSAAETVEAAYTRSPDEAFPSSVTAEVYEALNDPAVIQALGIPSDVVVRTPPE
ncbi:MAG: hypothetical protein ACRDGT_01845 [Candidatus Limnocylindria bacterium]